MAEIDLERVKTDGYEVVVGRHSLANLAELLSSDLYSGVKIFILADENTLQACMPVLMGKVPQLSEAEVVEVSAGEESKDLEVCAQIWSALGELGGDRSSIVINLGGGVVSDLGGFIAGAFKRGIRFINVPTSLLAQVDASIGGKVGVNLGRFKNEVGLFRNPESVFVDPEFLKSLPRNQLLSGFAEMIKHALISDPQYWEDLKMVSFYDLESLDASILHSIRIKNQIVTSDPFESGRRKLLNFGHTIGHAVESNSFEGDSRALLHGEAVALGMVCESYISNKLGLLSKEELNDIASFIFSHYSKIKIDELKIHRILELIKHDKKNVDGEIRMTLINGIGDGVYDEKIGVDLIVESLYYYERWAN